MDLSPANLFASLVVSSIGLFIFLRGKQSAEPTKLVIGLGLMGASYVAPGPLAMYSVAAITLGGWWAWARYSG